MKFRFRWLVLYVVSIILGYALLRLMAPLMAVEIFADRLPWRESQFAMWWFGYFYYLRAIYVLVAASVAALVGFWMWHNPALRRVTLTLPIWTPLLYSQIYLYLMLK
jgi:hypothetical protein